MKVIEEQPVLYPPLKTPRGWFVTCQPDYRKPNVFNLSERSTFKNHPSIRKEYGARILVSQGFRVAVQYMYLVDESYVDQVAGEPFSCLMKHGLIFIKESLKLDTSIMDKSTIPEHVCDEIRKTYQEWHDSFTKKGKGGKPDMEEVKRSLSAGVEKGIRLYHEWLINSNLSWIHPCLPRMIQDFRYGLLTRVKDTLHADYQQRGGNESEGDLLRKINIFIRIYESDGHVKPNGGAWLSEDEIWDCWVAFCGSDDEAHRVCSTIESTLIPLRDEIMEELNEVP